MHSLAQLLLDAPQFCPHAFADRPAPDLEGPVPAFPVNVRESTPGESHPEPLAEPDMNVSASTFLMSGSTSSIWIPSACKIVRARHDAFDEASGFTTIFV
jgi:hypothetical protein